MKSLRFLIVNLTLIFVFQIPLLAQQKSVVSIKIASISSVKFADASTGIKDIIAIE